MATVKAFIKVYKTDTPVKVRFRLRSGKEVDAEYTSEIEVLPKYWDSKIQGIKTSQFYSISDKLKIDSEISELRKLITNIYINSKDPSLLNSKYLTNQIKLSLEKANAESINSEIKEEIASESTVDEGINFFDVFNQSLLKNEYYIANEDKKFCFLFPKYNSNRPRGINATTGMMIKVRAFFNLSIKHGYTQNYPFSKIHLT